jgi:GNAT superfamily N-acetyltransferase
MFIQDLSLPFLNQFFDLFCDVMNNDFLEYTKNQRKYFLTDLYSKEKYKYFLHSSYRKTLIAIENDEVIGFLVADQTFGGVGFISWLGVLKQNRGKGVGTELVKFYEDFCKDKNAHLVEAYTFPKSIGFYKRLNFFEVGTRSKGYFGVKNIIVDKEI